MDLLIKKVNRSLKEYKEIKELFLKSFPKNERYPMWLLMLLALRKSVEFSAYYDGERFCGITYSITDKNTTFLLYLAVSDKVRSKGYGSKILSCIKEKYPKSTILFDIEKPNEKASNNNQRIKRMNFYLKNGFGITDYELIEKDESYIILSSDKNIDIDEYKKMIKKLSFGFFNTDVRKIQ